MPLFERLGPHFWDCISLRIAIPELWGAAALFEPSQIRDFPEHSQRIVNILSNALGGLWHVAACCNSWRATRYAR